MYYTSNYFPIATLIKEFPSHHLSGSCFIKPSHIASNTDLDRKLQKGISSETIIAGRRLHNYNNNEDSDTTGNFP